MLENYLEIDAWKIIERQWDAKNHKKSESIFSLGNGRMGQRAMFEETYTGQTLQGSYVAGVYYPDKTRVGWWKNGYPEYFAKVLNSVNWIGLHIAIDGEVVNLATAQVLDFYRELNMHEGYLLRTCTVKLPSGKTLKIEAQRFLSIVQDEVGAIKYSITPQNFSGQVALESYLDFDVTNEDSNYDEKFWQEVGKSAQAENCWITARTKKLDFEVCAAMRFDVFAGDEKLNLNIREAEKSSYVAHHVNFDVAQKQTYTIYKYVAVLSSLNHKPAHLAKNAMAEVAKAQTHGYANLLADQAKAWATKWQTSDIIIDGDAEAQQGIRFNIFHLNQTFTGVDARLNIGPKGFSGEKYGGATYWDTEAYCLPFYLATAPPEVAKNLVLYRHKHLGKAIENAEKLGFKEGAALYPMVTMNGEECHNEWEITFEEIHRNGAIAYGIFNYVRHTGDLAYLADKGLDVLLAISRFWAQRVNWSSDKEMYVILGVTGPNEYENNINNNWYTNKMAAWTLEWTLEVVKLMRDQFPDILAETLARNNFEEAAESKHWNHIIHNLHFPFEPIKGVFLQQDGFLDKEQLSVADLNPAERPINQHWSWDRILRSIFIKQADVLQGIYFLEHHYDKATVRRNFDFYEPKTVHESSLSPCVHAILAARVGYAEKAYEMYLRTARLDLDDYNHEVHEGLHITSMAGTWLSVVQGFGGMRIIKSRLQFDPALPAQWNSLKFAINWRQTTLSITIHKEKMVIENTGNEPAEFGVNAINYTVKGGDTETILLVY